jgi:uncharacterized coiled-coil protein SlyX
MQQKHINAFIIGAIIGLGYLSLRHEDTTQAEPINYELFEYKFKELQERIDTLTAQSLEQDTVINSIKFQIVTDEKTIRNASNSNIDSIFNAMVSRQHKGIVQRP